MAGSMVVAVLCGSTAFACALAVRRGWRGRSGPLDGVVDRWGLWSGSVERGRAGRRSVPAFGVAVGPLLAVVSVEFLRRALDVPGADVLVLPTVIVAAVFFAAGTCAFWTIPLYNRPKFLVPPPYRHEDGLVAARRKAEEREP